MAHNKDRLKELYFSQATQYYITARFAAISMMLPVCGNLFHHAIEMYLKGHLSIEFSKGELIALRHNLKKIWKLFKTEVNDPILNNFDQTITTLDKFEDIRYPDKIHSRGAIFLLIWEKASHTYYQSDRKLNTELTSGKLML